MAWGEVVRSERLTPWLVEVVLGGEGLAGLEPPAFSDIYINAQFGTDEVPRRRRITVRSWDAERREMVLWIASHGDSGLMGPWAGRARIGDRLEFKGPAGDYSPDLAADAYLFVGDESALPAIAACAEAVPEGKPVTVVVEVEDASGEVELSSPGELTVHWVHRGLDELDHQDGGYDDLLADVVATLPRPAGRVSAFVHGEAVATRNVRRVLLRDGIVALEALSCSPYWRRGYDDEAWRQIKGAWVREVNAELG